MIEYINYLSPEDKFGGKVRVISTLRRGGISSAPYNSLNLGHQVDDSAHSVECNRATVVKQLGLKAQPVWLNQVHGTHIVSATAAVDQLTPPESDGLFCDQSELPCAILTADCLPLAMGNLDTGAFVNLHVGWKGLAAGIIEAGLEALGGSSSIWAWAGPCIGPDAFEVGHEVREVLGGSDSAWKPVNGAHGESNAKQKWLCNLYAIVGERLADLGVNDYSHADACTYTQAEQFFSYRRDGITGRQATIAWRSV